MRQQIDQRNDRERKRQQQRILLREAEAALERELERQEILGRDIPRLIEVVLEKVWPSALL
jgi:hypothetical protein